MSFVQMENIDNFLNLSEKGSKNSYKFDKYRLSSYITPIIDRHLN